MSDEIRTVQNPAQLLDTLVWNVKKNTNSLVKGPIGHSKTTLCEIEVPAALRLQGFKVNGKTLQLSTLEPPDMVGAMENVNGVTTYGVPEKFFPSVEEYGDCDFYVITLDEATHERLMLKPAQRYILEREINGNKLDDRVRFILTSNLEHERAQLAELPPAFKDRLSTQYMQADFEGWIENFAVPAGIDPIIISWVYSRQGKMWDKPDLTKDGFCTPRGTAECSKHMNAPAFIRKVNLEGIIGYDEGTDLIGFKKAVDAGLPDIDAVLADPDAHAIPVTTGSASRGLHVALAMSLANTVSPDTFENFLKYMRRFTTELNDKPLEVLAVVSACEMQPELKSLLNDEYVKWIAENAAITVHAS